MLQNGTRSCCNYLSFIDERLLVWALGEWPADRVCLWKKISDWMNASSIKSPQEAANNFMWNEIMK